MGSVCGGGAWLYELLMVVSCSGDGGGSVGGEGRVHLQHPAPHRQRPLAAAGVPYRRHPQQAAGGHQAPRPPPKPCTLPLLLQVFRIDAIPSKQLETIKEWLTSVKIKYYESKLNLAWKPVLKNIMADPEGFVANGVCVCVCGGLCGGGAEPGMEAHAQTHHGKPRTQVCGLP